MGEVVFIPAESRRSLAAQWVRPGGASTRAPVVVHAHGWGSSRRSPRARAIAARLATAGIGSLLFDFTGHGESGGTKRELGVEQFVSDLRCAVAYAAADERSGAVGVSAASMGALAALYLCGEESGCEALVVRAAVVPEIGAARRLRAPTRFIHGDADRVADVKEARAFAEAVEVESDFVCVRGADHEFSRPEDLSELVASAVNWFVQKLRARDAVGRGARRTNVRE